MTNPELAQAREWAEAYKDVDDLTERNKAAINIIQSLPDRWVDAEKVQDLIDLYKCARDANGSGTEGWVINDLVIGNLEDLLLPNFPTLADMTQDAREACQWMQCSVAGRPGTHVVTEVRDTEMAYVLLRGGTGAYFRHNEITPLPDLPKLKWPEKEPSLNKDPLRSGVWVDDGSSPLDALKLLADKHEELDRLKPEDVPLNEPWLIEVDGWKAIGTRYPHYTMKPWSVAALNGLFSGDYMDSAVTLIHKPVPETHTLPEGMRLADHKEYGRVVVSPKVYPDGDYKAFLSDPGNVTGAAWAYVHQSKLTFLDGEKWWLN